MLLGSFFLAFVEIIPLTQLENKSKRDDECTENTIALSAPFAKLHLQELSLKVSNLEKIAEHSSSLGIQWHKKDNNHDHQNYGNQIWSGFLFTRQENNDKNIHDKKEPQQQSTDPPILYLPSEDPLRLHPIPCRAVGYVQRQGPLYPTSETTSDAIVSEGTLVRILPPIQQTNPSYYYPFIARQHALLQLLGEMQTSPITKEMEEELIHNHNPETIRELTLRMSLQLAEPVHIGTTGDAFSLKHKHQRQRQAMAKSLQNYCAKQLPKTQRQSPSRISPPNNTPLQGRQQQLPTIMRDGALLVHSPNHGSGKTELVKMIAQRRLQCNSVHVVQPGPLLAKYGSHADTALECMLHAITMSAAAKGTDCGSICIILDHLDAMMPPKLSGKLATGDAAAPVLNAVGKKNLTATASH